MTLIAVAVCSCWTQAWLSGCRSGHWIIFIFNYFDRCGRPILLDASLVVGMQALSLDDFISNDVACCGRLFLMDASLIVGMQVWLLDDFILNDVDRWARLLL